MKIRIANENNKLFLASWGEEVEITQEEADILTSGLYTIVQEGETYKIIARPETNEELRVKYEAEIKRIHDDFDSAISEYLSKYPKREQDTFAEKKREAEKVVNGGESLYIDNKAQALGISSLQFANIIIAKNNEWTLKYIELENAKDMEVMQLEQKLAELDF